jgi:hypothetical protein
MSSLFPTSLDNLDATRGTDNQALSSPNHVTHHTNEDDAIEALQTKVGVDGSAVTSTLDYKLKSASSVSPGHKHVIADINDLSPIATSVGVADAGKIIKTDALGLIDATLIPDTFSEYVSTFSTQNVAESMNGSVTPVAVCISVDGNIQKAEADVTGVNKFIGFVTENISNIESEFINGASGTASPLSFTPGAGDFKVLFVHVGLYRNLTNVVLPTGITFGGNAMTLVDSTTPDVTPGDTFAQVVYALPIGSSVANASIAVVGGTYEDILIQAVCYSNTDQTTPTLIKSKATGSSASPSTTVDPSSAYSRVVTFLVSSNNPTITWTSGQTQRDGDSFFVGSYGIAISDVSNKLGTSTAYGATLSPSGAWGIQAVELKQHIHETTRVQIAGVISYPSLTTGITYYLSNTAGAISTTAGTTSVKVGKTLSTSSLFIIQE